MSSQEPVKNQPQASQPVAAPLEPRSALRPVTSLLFPIVGSLLFVAGLAITIGPAYVSELAWYAKTITRSGFSGQVFCLAGLMLVGMGWLSRYQRLHARTLLEPGMAESMIEDVRGDVVATQDLIRQLGGMQVEQGVDLRYLKKAIGEARNEARANDPKDAIFRLAASLDQLGARLDQRIGEATNVLQDSNYELSSLVESTSEGLQDKIDRSSRSLSREVLETISNVTLGLNEAEEDDDEGLEPLNTEGLRVLVDLEMDPVEEVHEQRDLGLLNELGDTDRPVQPSIYDAEDPATPRESAG